MRDPKEVTVLVVDDEAALKKALVFDFKRKGYRVLEAGNGKEAFDVLSRENVDIVLSDIRMPGGDGVELLGRIRERHAEIPIVLFLTGFADISLEEALDRGVAAVFPKPFDRKLLAQSVANLILSREERWTPESDASVTTDCRITLSFPNLNKAVEGQMLNIGRGGMFVTIKDFSPVVGSLTSFCIRFDSGNLQLIEGSGTVRWVREQKNGDLPPGCGIEFKFLGESSRKQVIAFINNSTAKAFIPKN